MPTIYPRLAFEATDSGRLVRSLTRPKRGAIEPLVLLRTGRWPNGEALAGSDAYDIARKLKPAPLRDKRSAYYRR